jgi:hypothetical protein
MVIFSGPLLLRPKLPPVTDISSKIDSFPVEFAVVLGAKFVQGVANKNDTVLEGLFYTSSEKPIFI